MQVLLQKAICKTHIEFLVQCASKLIFELWVKLSESPCFGKFTDYNDDTGIRHIMK